MTLSRRPAISVCVALHNGMPHVVPQLRSILAEVGPDDQLVLVDDASRDGSLEEARRVLTGHRNTVLKRNATNLGHMATFRRAFSLATNPVIVVSDQDDIWPEGRLLPLLERLVVPDTALVFGSLALLHANDRPPDALTVRSTTLTGALGLFRFIVERNTSYGSACAFWRSLVDLEVPLVTETYEQWLVAQSLSVGSVAYVADLVTLRREHDTNLTRQRALTQRLVARVAAARHMLVTFLARRWARA